MRLYKIVLFFLLALGIQNIVLGQATIKTRMVPYISSDNDSLYLDIEVSKEFLTDALGNADFPFRITDSRTRVQGLPSPIDLNGFRIVRRGRWDANNDTNFVAMELVKTVENSTFVLKVRTKVPKRETGASRNIMPNNFGAAGFVVRLGTRIYDGACVDTIRIEWSRNLIAGRPSGYLTSFRVFRTNTLVNNNYIPISDNSYIKLRPILEAPLVGASPLPQGVLFTWYKTPSVNQYYARIVKNNKAETTYVRVGNSNTTEYRVNTVPYDTVYFTLFSKSGCSSDSAKSEIAFGPALECPNIRFAASDIRLNGSNPFCPALPITVTIDTIGKNLANPVGFSFNGGLTYQTSNSYTCLPQSDTSLQVTFKDFFGCSPNLLLPVNITLLRLQQANTIVSFAAPRTACNNEKLQFTYTATGDNLGYVWRSSGTGIFTDGQGNVLANPTQTTVFYQSSGADTGNISITVINDCFGVKAINAINLKNAPVASLKYDETKLVDNKFLAGEPILFNRTAAKLNETYEFTFSDNIGNVASTTDSTIMRSFNSGGSYTLTLIVRLPNGCSDTAVLPFEVFSDNNLYIPTIFSPVASNPLDKTFRFNGSGVEEQIDFKVFDQWGKLVYSTESYTQAKNEGWNGIKMSDGRLCQSGNYTFVVRGKFTTGTAFERSGSVALVR
jgi:hypothetical protein